MSKRRVVKSKQEEFTFENPLPPETRTPAFPPPEGYKYDTRKNRAWCPYCAKETAWHYDTWLNVAFCADCGVSAEDYWVRRHNGLWEQARKNAFERAAARAKAVSRKKLEGGMAYN